MSMRRSLIFFACLVIVLPVAVFAGGQRERDPDAVIEIKVTTTDAPSTVWVQALRGAAERIAERTDGRVDVQLYPSGELMVYDEAIEAVMSNADIMYFTEPGTFGEYVPEYLTISAPYMFSSYEAYEEFAKTDTMKQINDRAASAGLRAIAPTFVLGHRSVLANKPVHTVQDLQGLRLRVPGLRSFTDTFEALGANYQAMPFNEVFSAIQTGVLDGLESSIGNAYNNVIYDAFRSTPYFSKNRHLMTLHGLFAGEQFWQSIPEEYRIIIEEEMAAAAYANNRDVVRADEELLQKLVDEGVEIVYLNDLSSFQEAVQPLVRTYENYDQIAAEIAVVEERIGN